MQGNICVQGVTITFNSVVIIQMCTLYMFLAHSRENATSYWNLLQILTLEAICKFKLVHFIQKKKMKGDPTNSPAISSGILALTSEIHNYNTRVNLNIHRQSVYYLYYISYFLIFFKKGSSGQIPR